jgi:hypothetical protein
MESLAGVINDLRGRVGSLTVGTAMAVVSFCSGFISYTHISALTLHVGQSWKTAHLMPFCVDGQIVIGSAYFMYGKNWKSKSAGLIFGVIPGIAESLIANWESGIVHGLFAAGWATVPAQAFACSTILFERWLHARREEAPDAKPVVKPVVKQETETIPEAAPSAPEPAAPAAPAGAGPLGLPVPVLGPVTALNGHRPAQAAVPRVVKVPAPREDDTRLPLPSGAELAALLGDPATSANQISRDYAVGRWTANQMKKQFAAGELVPEEVKASAAA